MTAIARPLARIVCLAVIVWAAGPAWAERLVLVVGGGDGPDGGPAVGAKLGQPFGVAIDGAGNLFIADYTDHRVRKVDPAGTITTVAGTGEAGFSGDGGPATAGRFDSMHDLVVAESGDVYVADSDNRRVRKIDAATGILTTVAGTGEKRISGDGGPGEAAGLDGVASLFLDPTGTKLYITGFSRVVRVLDLATGTIDTVDGLPGGRSVAVDSRGNVYVAGGTTLHVRRPDGTVELLHDAATAPAGAVAIGKNAKHLGLDEAEDVLIADNFAHQIKRYDVTAGRLAVVAGTGRDGRGEPGRAPRETALSGPHGVYYHRPTKSLYVCDSQNGRVFRVEP